MSHHGEQVVCVLLCMMVHELLNYGLYCGIFKQDQISQINSKWKGDAVHDTCLKAHFALIYLIINVVIRLWRTGYLKQYYNDFCLQSMIIHQSQIIISNDLITFWLMKIKKESLAICWSLLLEEIICIWLFNQLVRVSMIRRLAYQTMVPL